MSKHREPQNTRDFFEIEEPVGRERESALPNCHKLLSSPSHQASSIKYTPPSMGNGFAVSKNFLDRLRPTTHRTENNNNNIHHNIGCAYLDYPASCLFCPLSSYSSSLPIHHWRRKGSHESRQQLLGRGCHQAPSFRRSHHRRHVCACFCCRSRGYRDDDGPMRRWR